MAFVAGYNAVVKLDASPGGALTDYTANFTNLDTNIPVELLGTTVFSKAQRTRAPGLKDFSFTLTANPDSAGVISAIVTGHVQSSESISFELSPEGTATGSLKLTGEAYLESIAPTASVDGLATFTATYQGTDTTTIGTNA